MAGPIVLQPWPENPLKDVFPPEVLAAWKRRPSKDIIERWQTLEAEGFYSTTNPHASAVRHRRGQKAAWETYLAAAFACQLFEGAKGSDLRSRLAGWDSDNFRSAMAECMACWYLAGKCRLSINPSAPGRGAKNLEMVVFWKDASIAVEVKAPHQESPASRIGSGNGSHKLETVIERANKQFDNNGPNLLVIVPSLRLRMHHHRTALAHALYGQTMMEFRINRETGTAEEEGEARFVPVGKLFKAQKADGSPGYQRISAVLCIEQYPMDSYPHPSDREDRLISWRWREADMLHDSPANQVWMEHRALVLHNPFAYFPLDQELFHHLPQMVPDGPTMRWTDGHDATV